MYDIEAIPGPCCLCYQVELELKSIPGRCGDGICERCDEIRFKMTYPGRRWASFDQQKAFAARKVEAEETQRLRVGGAPLRRSVPVARTVASAMRRVS